MFVHTDKARINRVAPQFEDVGAARHLGRGSVPDGDDSSVIDDDGLICARGCARAVDDAYVLERDNRIVKAQEGLNSGRPSALP